MNARGIPPATYLVLFLLSFPVEVPISGWGVPYLWPGGTPSLAGGYPMSGWGYLIHMLRCVYTETDTQTDKKRVHRIVPRYSWCTEKDGNTNSHWVMCTCSRYLFWYWSRSRTVWMCHSYYSHWFQVLSMGGTPVLAGRGGAGVPQDRVPPIQVRMGYPPWSGQDGVFPNQDKMRYCPQPGQDGATPLVQSGQDGVPPSHNRTAVPHGMPLAFT